MPEPKLGADRHPGVLNHRAELRSRLRDILPSHKVKGVLTHDFFRLIAQDALDGWTLIPDRAIGTKNRDQIGGVLYQSPEMLFTATDRSFRLHPLTDIAGNCDDDVLAEVAGSVEDNLLREYRTVDSTAPPVKPTPLACGCTSIVLRHFVHVNESGRSKQMHRSSDHLLTGVPIGTNKGIVHIDKVPVK